LHTEFGWKEDPAPASVGLRQDDAGFVAALDDREPRAARADRFRSGARRHDRNRGCGRRDDEDAQRTDHTPTLTA
jgi:hypothetical protein